MTETTVNNAKKYLLANIKELRERALNSKPVDVQVDYEVPKHE